MNFNETTATWFDYMKNNRDECNLILQAVQKKSNKENLGELLHALTVFLFHHCMDNPFQMVLSHALRVERGEFKKEFRYRYSRYSGNVSQCSELFNSLRQVITYNDK